MRKSLNATWFPTCAFVVSGLTFLACSGWPSLPAWWLAAGFVLFVGLGLHTRNERHWRSAHLSALAVTCPDCMRSTVRYSLPSLGDFWLCDKHFATLPDRKRWRMTAIDIGVRMKGIGNV